MVSTSYTAVMEGPGAPAITVDEMVPGGSFKCNGDPNDADIPARLGQFCIDLDTGDVWIKRFDDSKPTGWTKIGGSGEFSVLDFAVEGETPFYGSGNEDALFERAMDALATIVLHSNTYAIPKIFLPAPPTNKFYRITAPIDITLNGMQLVGETKGVKIHNVTSGSDVIRINYEGAGWVDDVLYNVVVKDLTLIGTGTTSRAIYANQTDHLVIDVDTTQHPGISLYQESTGTAFTGCDFGDICILCQPSQAVTNITSIGGRSNTYRSLRLSRAEFGLHLIDEDCAVIDCAHVETINRGTAKIGIKATHTALSHYTKRSIIIRGGYAEDCENFFIDASSAYTVLIDGMFMSGGTGDKIKIAGGGRLHSVNSTSGVKVESSDVVDVFNCANIYGRAANLRHRSTSLPLPADGVNLATKSWFDTDPTWTSAGVHPPVFTVGTGVGFYGKNSKIATFPATATGFADSIAVIGNATLSPTVSGERINAIVVVKFDRAGEVMLWRFNSTTAVQMISDTEWQIIFLSYETTVTSVALSLAPLNALSSSIAATVGAIAIARNAYPVLSNTEGSVDGSQFSKGVFISPRAAATASPINGQIENVGGNVTVRSGGKTVPLYRQSLSSSITVIGNIGAGEDDLMSYTVPGGTVAAEGDTLEAHMAGVFAASANAKTVKIYFGGVEIFSSGAIAVNDGSWSAVVRITRRTTSNSQYISVMFMTSDPAILAAKSNVLAATVNLSSDAVLKVTGETGGANSNDVQQYLQLVRLIKAP